MAKGNGVSIETVQPMVKVDSSVGNLPISATFNQIAAQNTFLSDLGAFVAQQGANAQAEVVGAEAGKTPSGEPRLPPLTDAAKHYQMAYDAQAQNTLTLQLNKTMAQANAEADAANRLNPQMIQSYEKNLTQAGKDIISNAPDSIKGTLSFQYANQILGNTEKLNSKMLRQQHEEAVNNAQLANKIGLTNIIDLSRQGNPQAASVSYDHYVEANNKMAATGLISSQEAYNNNRAAKISLYSGQYTYMAQQARAQKGDALGKLLTSFGDIKKKPAGLTTDEWDAVGNNVLSAVKHQDTLEANQVDVLTSEIIKDATLGQLNEDKLTAALNNPVITETSKNKILTSIFKAKAKQSDADVAKQDLSTNFANPAAFAGKSGSVINKVYEEKVLTIQQQRPSSGLLDAESAVAVVAGRSIPQFLDTVQNLSRSNNANEVIAAANAYHRVQDAAPQNLEGLDNKAYLRIAAFDAFMKMNPGDPQTAVSKMRQAMIQKTPEELDAINGSLSSLRKEKYATTAQKQSFANKMLDKGYFDSLSLQNPVVSYDRMVNSFFLNANILGGDTEAAELMTKQQIADSYKKTWVNGREEVAYGSIEGALGTDRTGTFFVQQDMVKQLQGTFNSYKSAYDSGRSDFYYEIKNPEKWNDDGVRKAAADHESLTKKIQITDAKLYAIRKTGQGGETFQNKEFNALRIERAELSAQQSELNTLIKNINEVQSPVQIEKVYRGGDQSPGKREKLNMAIVAADNAALSNTASPIVGNFYVKLITENGFIETLNNIQGFKTGQIPYRPDYTRINKNYIAYKSGYKKAPTADDNLDSYFVNKEAENNG